MGRLGASVQLPSSESDFTMNTPPVMFFDRNWKISETEKIDSVIARVQAHDNEQDILTFGLEQDGLNGADADEPLPFRIDPNTGIVYLNESLEGRGGQNFFLYVTVFDGALKAKNQVYVNVKGKNDVKTNGRPPSFTPNTTGLFPPFHTLPGVQPPNRPKPFPFPPYDPTPPPLLPSLPPTSNTVYNPLSPDSNSNSNGTTTSKGGNASIPINGSKTHEIPFGANSNGTIDEGHTNSTTSNSTNPFTRTPLNTVVPLAIIICGVILASGLIVSSFIFRKRLCAIGKSLKKKSKEEMAKKSNQSNFSSSSNNGGCEDSRNSIVMQHWNGPTAFSNRYVPWERENTHIQVRFHSSSIHTFVCAEAIKIKAKKKQQPPSKSRHACRGEGAGLEITPGKNIKNQWE